MKTKFKRSTGQGEFLGKVFRSQKAFGGALLKKSNPKFKRPVSTKHPLHIVLRSSQAKGKWSFRSSRNMVAVNKLVYLLAKTYGLKIVEFANVGNHLHLLVRVPHRLLLTRFLRVLSGRLSMLVTGARKGERLSLKFWDFRPFSRVVTSWRGYLVARDYVVLNQLEAAGVIPSRRSLLVESS